VGTMRSVITGGKSGRTVQGFPPLQNPQRWASHEHANERGQIVRNSCGMLLIATSLVLGASSSDQPSQPPFSITISTERPDIKAGSEVYIKIQMKNNSDHEMDCSKAPTNGWDAAYQYDVRDARGNLAERILPVPGHPEIKDNSSIWPCILKLGESTSIDSIVSRRNDMSRPGKYVIQVSRFIVSGHKESGVVKSNTITITVAP
jgi:hypothetical protein